VLVRLLVNNCYHVMCSCNFLELSEVLLCLVIFAIRSKNGEVDGVMMLKFDAKSLILF